MFYVLCDWNVFSMFLNLLKYFQIEDAESDRDIKPGWVLDNFPRTNSQMQDLQESGILPDCLLCLSDTDENHGVRLRNNANNFLSNLINDEL